MDKELLEKELKELKTKYEIALSRIQTLKSAYSEATAEILSIKGAIDQTEKLLALYNNENLEMEENKNDN